PLFPTQPVEGQAFTNLQFATVFDSDATVVPSNFTVTINWGDGTPLDTTTGSVTAISGSPQAFAVNGSHTYAQETGSAAPPAALPVTLTVTDTKNNVTTTVNSSAFVADAGLSQGNPVTGTPTVFLGGGTNQPDTATELAAFKSAIGGANNGATPAPQNGG